MQQRVGRAVGEQDLATLRSAGTPIASTGSAGQRHHIKGSEKPVGLGSCRPLGNPPSTSNGVRSPASLGRRAAGLSLDSKEKPRLTGTGPEFDWGETLEVSCLTHHPNPPT